MQMSGMSSNDAEQKAYSEREKFVMAFNDTMLKIWKEQMTLLGVIDTGALLASPKSLPVRADGRFIELGLSQSFLELLLSAKTQKSIEILSAMPINRRCG